MLIPALITLEDRRKEERVSPDTPDFISAIFRWEKGFCKAQTYELDILNYSMRGLALLLIKKDDHLFTSLESGDRISEMMLFAESALTVVNGTVRHKTCIEDGAYRRHFVIGIETDVDLFPAKSELALSGVLNGMDVACCLHSPAIE